MNETEQARLVFTADFVNTLFYVIVIILGVLGNLWVTWKVGVVLAFGRRVTVPRAMLLCILAICLCDLVVLTTLCALVDFRINMQWRFGLFACKLFYGVEVLNKFAIPLVLVQISRIQYAAARDTIRADTRRITLWIFNSVIVATFLVLMAYVFNTAELSPHHRYGNLCTFLPTYDKLFNGVAFIVGYVLSVAYVYFYVSLPLVLKKRRDSQATRTLMSKQASNIKLSRIRRTVLTFIAIYLICWTPYWTLFWITNMTIVLPDWAVIASMYAHALPYLACALYPIILTCQNEGIHNAHSTIIDIKKRQLITIRSGIVQVLNQVVVFQPNNDHSCASTDSV